MPWLIHNLFRLVFKRSALEYLKILVKGAGVSVLAGFISYILCGLVPFGGIAQLIANGIVCVLSSLVVLFVVYRKDPMYGPFLDLCDRVSKYKFSRIFEMLK